MVTSLLNRFNQFALKLSSNTVVLSLREGYIALIPFFIVASVITLLNQWLGDDLHKLKYQALGDFNTLVWGIFPLLTLISFSYYLSKNLKVHTIAGPVLVLACFTATTGYIEINQGTLSIVHRNGMLYSLLMPVLCCYLLAYIERIRWLRLVGISSISLFLRKHLNLIIPYILVTAIILLVIPVLDHFAGQLHSTLKLLNPTWNVFEKVSAQLIFSHLLWFIGVHGDNTYHLLVSGELTDYQVLPQLSSYAFYTCFVIIGGTGCIWGLIIASLLLKNARHERSIAMIASPLALFNISEVMLYALPIVFNPYLLIPFLLSPLLNALIAYGCISTGVIALDPAMDIPWFTPVFVSGWLLTQSLSGVLLQLVLIALNAALYYPFLKLNRDHNLSGKALDVLLKRFTTGRLIEAGAESSYTRTQREEQINVHSLKEVTDALNSGELMLFYQPKINPYTKAVVGFEALLRLKDTDGRVQGPWFLATLEQHGLLHIIDNFVIDQLEVDLEHFAREGFRPKVSFNISPQNLLSGGYKRIVKAFADYPGQVEVELLESSYIEDFNRTVDVVNLLRAHHIACAMDDFGTGYSCLSVLSKLNIDTIKLDRSLLPDNYNCKSVSLYTNLSEMIAKLGFRLVAEGVETKEEENLVKQSQVDCVQGFLYYKAMPIEEAMTLLQTQTEASQQQKATDQSV
ncbi:PTS sugar transporter subunit IIC/EAL domain-containing protein [Pseudoalteromonas viridis]|uniref:PTS sugar transporter subunit IIC/EAL domain-containing protein n=1 Tax=Pseudoalteromonas viridis TaxID=339617 RepID=A0ABX7VF86_9GAMM|nr:PTS sugar transporter subunit IIC/EAL domain-containing protein [Pseudoalteromonas viridis]